MTSCKSLTDLNMLDYREEVGAKAPQRCGVQGHGRSLWQELRGRFLEASGAPLLSDDVERNLDVYPVHLVREPKGQINSVVRKQAASSSISSAMS